jgi:L-cysteine S-thiosulfotransferase
MKSKTIALGAAVIALAGCASVATSPDYGAMLSEMMRSSFRDEGIAKTDRLVQDAANAACSEAMAADVSADVAQSIEKEAMKTVRYPADGKFIGDWREGEKLAQNGRGMTWTDSSAATSANGGNCLNCHQVTKEEISFGTIGPSLYQYGKIRGVSDVQSEQSRPIVEYTWGKIYNPRATNACSHMPRFGHAGLLDEAQMKDLMALLLDPKSPVNH